MSQDMSDCYGLEICRACGKTLSEHFYKGLCYATGGEHGGERIPSMSGGGVVVPYTGTKFAGTGRGKGGARVSADTPYVCAFTNSAGTPTEITHAGPRDAAITHFHAQIGPKWPVTLDGVKGHFTHLDETGGEATAPRFVPEA